MTANNNNEIADGVNVKTVNGKHGSFQILRIDVKLFEDWMNKNKCDNHVTIAIYPRKEKDEWNNTHTPKLFK